MLQAVRLKGRVSRDDLAATLGSEDVVEYRRPAGRGGPAGRRTDAADQPRGSRASRGVARRASGSRSTRPRSWPPTTNSVPSTPNSRRWSPTGSSRAASPTPHDDTDYDAAVLARLDDVHQRVVPIVARRGRRAAATEPLLGETADSTGQGRAGETMWLSRPLIDSYHTVWFELHEELILAAGLTREADDA